jgi:outer membrane protein assembly factor BamA
VFDNFVWMSDDELRTALRVDVPEFDGKTTTYAGAPDLIAGALQKILAERHLPGHVSVMPQFPLGATKGEPVAFIISVNEPAPALCALHVAGASAISGKELASQLGGAVGGPYSREFLRAASAGTLTDMYHRVGHWRAAFDTPTVALNECSGVAVTLNVDEGAAYAWDHADWAGNASIASSALDKLLTMKTGEMADGGKIAAGLIAIRTEYGRHGYIEESARSEPRLDDSTHRAIFLVKVQEGPQYTMGSLQFVGIRDADADKLQKQWQLKQGEVFDESYMKEYQTKVLGPLQSPSGGRPVLDLMLDRDHHVANLRVRVE